MKRFFLCIAVTIAVNLTGVIAQVSTQAFQSKLLAENSKKTSAQESSSQPGTTRRLIMINENSELKSGLSATADSNKVLPLEEVVIVGNRAGLNTPVAQTNLETREIKSLTVANNLPHVLWMTPSLVATSENGTGAGYSSFRIRGTDASRINITLNGIPLNNPESQEVYWVNIPDMTSALQNIQIQRGVGTSANGTGAFGASVNMTTKSPDKDKYLQSTTTVGSYGTFQQNIAFGTGRFGNGFSVDMRYSNLTSDGYIRNGWCDHQSLFALFSKRFKKSLLQFNYIYGNQHTGITWEGISEEMMKTNPAYNPAGEIKDGVYYDNESDNYRQHHLQLFYTHELSRYLIINAGLNYTDGFGYYEQYKQSKKFSSMGIADQTVDGVLYKKSDIIRRKNMDNGFYTGNINLKYSKKSLNIDAGTMMTYYDGDHFANLLWVENNNNIPDNFEWVRNNAKKSDANIFIKAEYTFAKRLNAYVDMQYRYVDYKLSGIDDDDMLDLTQQKTWNFFNPKAGLLYKFDEGKLFASVSTANREPSRADIKDAIKYGLPNRIKPEKLTDYELGYSYDDDKLMGGVNLYYMRYKDQLVPTGKLNEVGYKLMSNVEASYRAGIEVNGGYRFGKKLILEANATLSRNRVLDYTAWYETYDNSGDWNPVAQESKYFKDAKLPFSPEFIAAFNLTWFPVKDLKFNYSKKFVSKQYLTNTQNEDLSLPAYNSANFSLVYGFKILKISDAELGLHIINLANKLYSCNGWAYEARFANGDAPYIEKGLYPVAPRNFLIKFAVHL